MSSSTDRKLEKHLVAYKHQVAGHSIILLYDRYTICKPLNRREYNFYMTMPDEMKDFTALHKGSAIMTYDDDKEGLKVSHQCKSDVKRMKSRNAERAPSTDVEHGKLPQPFLAQVGCQGLNNAKAKYDIPANTVNENKVLSSKEESDQRLNQCVRENCKRTRQDAEGCFENDTIVSLQNREPCQLFHKTVTSIRLCEYKYHEFQLLENLLSRCSQPCVLDLKMGTRGYGDDAPEHKVIHHTNRYLATTSAKLGVRLCGMKVYKIKEGRYVHYDRVFGRTLNKASFTDLFHEYIQDGDPQTSVIIEAIIDRLNKLYKLVSSLESFRFYSGSLLIIYDAADIQLSNTCTTCPNQIKIEKPLEVSLDICKSKAASETGFTSEDAITKCPDKTNNKRFPYVDIRMIDFAHATYKDFLGDHVVHCGPDEGYLKGLKTIKSIFERNLKMLNGYS